MIISNNRDINVGNLISLSYLLEEKVRLLLTTTENIPRISKNEFSEVLIWNLSPDSLTELQEKNNCSISIINGGYYPPLWLVSL